MEPNLATIKLYKVSMLMLLHKFLGKVSIQWQRATSLKELQNPGFVVGNARSHLLAIAEEATILKIKVNNNPIIFILNSLL